LSRLANLPLLVILMGIAALAMLLPAAHASAMGEHRIAQVFLYAGVLTGVLTAMVGVATASYRPADVPRSQLGSLAAAFLVLPVVLALPFHQAVRDTTFLNAWFEMVSCLTTTGATVYESPGRLVPTLHLWRALVGWMGGAFVLVAGAAILSPLDLGGAEVLTGRVPGHGVGGASRGMKVADPAERLVRHTLVVMPVYTGLTLALWVLLLTAGEDGLLAMVLALSTMSTSGILPGVPLSYAFAGFWAESFVFLFMGLALTRRSLPGSGRGGWSDPPWRDPELRVAAAILVLVPVLVILRNWAAAIELDEGRNLLGALHALWGAAFTTMSFLTTTGFESADWVSARAWSGIPAPGLMLLGLAMMGGGIATTAGGLKLLRVYALARHGERELDRIVHPHSVSGGGEMARRLRNEGAYAAWIFFMLFAMTLALVIAALSLMQVPFEPAMVLAIASVTTTGPLAVVAAEAPLSYADLSGPVKTVLAGAMIVGRLEVLAVLALLAPGSWRR
jgi:trk system potassium uptake protein TrkH